MLICTAAAKGPEMMRGTVEKATKIENWVPVNCVLTKRINKATKAVEPMPAAKLSKKYGTSQQPSVFYPLRLERQKER